MPVDSLLIAQEPWPADFDDNGAVDAEDFSVWRGDFGLMDVGNGADADFDGDADGDDFLIWQREAGQNHATTQAVVIAEPAAAQLVMLASIALPLARLSNRKAWGTKRR